MPAPRKNQTYYKGKKTAAKAKYKAKYAAKKAKAAASIRPDYTTGIMSGIGKSVFGPLGGVAGSALDAAIDSGIKYFTGKGAYSVKKNSLLDEQVRGRPLSVVNRDRSGGFLVRRSEYIGDIISSGTAGAFKLQSFDVNPGLENTFQWLSQIACNFEEYEMQGIYFEYRSMSADALNSVNTALGSVIMSASYNAANPNFTSKQAMENYENGCSCKPSSSMRFFIECARNRSVLSDLYVRSGVVPSGQDQRFFDLANFQIATQGMQGTNVNLGELWVSYQVSLRKPKLFAALGLYSSFAQINVFNGLANATPLGTSWVYNVNNTLGVTLTSTTITFPFSSLGQSYQIAQAWHGNSTAVTLPGYTVSAGLVINFRSFTVTGTVCTDMYAIYTLYVPGNNLSSVITLDGTGVIPSPNPSMYMYINQIPNTYLGF